ncbi:uncharacterized protein Z519_10484 [Cladophialophora bantiana CBS 173.52]|uniref:Uncharacterized protein n=1 Tax=Cladophialophora bantiana (strain ATCC 10958 / CBS 173.52 / CDC B-1940 / NIH 8579) TaxID=1442370 RepID=A0A0D2HWU4_CLAB1|nr:uncharacterized protein Z519_10484 [Cladophialophora bantiana CBS 173.52]KIW88999.1 hypothetical protein Z519_10484 [Cladophialophora bantiana CBS 173.52]
MKKLTRTLSARSRSKSHPQPLSIKSNGKGSGGARSNQAHVRKSSLTSPIPPNTQIHFPQCPHTTPPTPRPARLPSVLRTEIIEDAQTPEEPIPGRASNGLAAAADKDWNVRIRQFLIVPTHCLDCTFSLALQQESWIRERCAAVVRESKLRVVELKSGLAALSTTDDGHDPRTVHTTRVNSSELGDDSTEDVQTTQKAEITYHEQRIEEQLRRRDDEVRKMWDQIRGQWEGCIREVVRDDGTSEAEERCVFVMPWDQEEVVSEGVKEGNADKRAREECLPRVRVEWLPIEE